MTMVFNSISDNDPKLSFWTLRKEITNLRLVGFDDRKRILDDPSIMGITVNNVSPMENAVLDVWLGEHPQDYIVVSKTETFSCSYDGFHYFGISKGIWCKRPAMLALIEAWRDLPARDVVTKLPVRAISAGMRRLMHAANVLVLRGMASQEVEVHLSHPSRLDMAPILAMAKRIEQVLNVFVGPPNDDTSFDGYPAKTVYDEVAKVLKLEPLPSLSD